MPGVVGTDVASAGSTWPNAAWAANNDAWVAFAVDWSTGSAGVDPVCSPAAGGAVSSAFGERPRAECLPSTASNGLGWVGDNDAGSSPPARAEPRVPAGEVPWDDGTPTTKERLIIFSLLL
jgi:hypothetical protein